MAHNLWQKRGRWLTVVVGLGWLAFVVGGTLWMSRYSMTPGTAAAATTRWPGAPQMPLARDCDTLVMFLHPQCVCSRASLEELDRLITRCGSQIFVSVVILRPRDRTDDSSREGLWKSASAIPGVVVRPDADGKLASQFGAKTSGQTFLYDPSGRLLFEGGITGSRGHAGDNAGMDAVIALVSHRQEVGSSHARTPTFGCPLGDESATTAPGGGNGD